MVHFIKGNLLDSNLEYICHQVNCRGVMGAGIAKQIRNRWPEVYGYYIGRYYQMLKLGDPDDMLGSTDFVELENDTLDRKVINIYGQSSFGRDHIRYTSYDAFENALWEIANTVPVGKMIGFPKGIGCGHGGGDWNIILRMIESVLGNNFEVYICELEV